MPEVRKYKIKKTNIQLHEKSLLANLLRLSCLGWAGQEERGVV